MAQRGPGLTGWQQEPPEAAGWQPWTGWGWLAEVPAELHGVARALTYTTQVLTFSSPTAGLLPELVDDDARGLLLECLVSVGLVRLYSHASGVRRWERASQST